MHWASGTEVVENLLTSEDVEAVGGGRGREEGGLRRRSEYPHGQDLHFER